MPPFVCCRQTVALIWKFAQHNANQTLSSDASKLQLVVADFGAAARTLLGMARICPTLSPHSAINAGEYAEIALLETLKTGLSDAYTLFHSVDWSRGSKDLEQHGEIDIVAVNQQGDVLLMEVKAGQVDFLSGGIFKTYAGRAKNITAQIGLQYGALRSRLQDAGLTVHPHGARISGAQ